MAVILGDALSGAPPEQVAEVPQDIVYQVFGRELSMGKSMGLDGDGGGLVARRMARQVRREGPDIRPVRQIRPSPSDSGQIVHFAPKSA